MDQKQAELFKKMTPFEKLYLAQRLYKDARLLKEAGLRKFFPELSGAEIKEKVKRIFLYARN